MIIRWTHIALIGSCLLFVSFSGAFAQSGDKQVAQPRKNTSDNVSDWTAPYVPSSDSVSADDFKKAHARLLETERLQFERPVETVEPRELGEPPAFFRWLGSLLQALGPLFQLLFYIGAFLIVAGIVYFILKQIPTIRLRGRQRQNKKTEQTDHIITTVRPDEKKARSWLEEADALARDGKYSEAAHLLLFRSIEDIQSRRKQKIPTALTAREIEQLDGLPERPRDALRPIIALVERSFFGGHTVDGDNWAAARAAYEDFAFGDAWT